MTVRTLGAILAGGQSRRFGSDKAHALFDGKRLIDHTAAALRQQCEAVIICGREEPGFTCIPDLPTADIGPLGGLNAALNYAARRGFTHILSAGVDAPNLPQELKEILTGEGAAIAESQPVVGLWPVTLASTLNEFLSDGGRALYGFAKVANARQIRFDPPLMNVNGRGDLP